MQPQLAAQMYTVREFTKTADNFARSLERIKDSGYHAVQLSAIGAMNGDSLEVSPKQAKSLLDSNGLRCIATHRSWDDLLNKIDEEIEFHHIMECDYVAIGGVPGSYTSDGKAGYQRWLSDALPVIARLKEAGIRFGYHNHAHEFERVGPERQWVYSLFLDKNLPDLYLEIDVYWVEHAGVNPTRLINDLHGKLPVVHIKDKEMIGSEPVMAPIGEGNLDWQGILPALEQAGTKWLCVEQDICRRDPFDCLRSSYRYLAENFGLV